MSSPLDPAFLRAHDPQLYDAYVDAIHLRRDPFEVVSEVFAAPYVYVENTSHSRTFYEALDRRPTQFRKVYQDSFAAVFETLSLPKIQMLANNRSDDRNLKT